MNAKKLLVGSVGLFLVLAPTSHLISAEQPSMAMVQDQDANVTLAVKDAFAADPTLAKDASAITVVSKDGKVTLAGTVADKETKDLFQKKAESVKGVKSVSNSIKVQ